MIRTRIPAAFATLCVGAAIAPLDSPAASMSLLQTIGGNPAGVTLDSTAVRSQCCPSGQSTLILVPTALPFADQHRAEIGGVFSETSYQLTRSAFEISFEHFRYPDSGVTSTGRIYFTVGADVPYALMGDYAVVGLGNAHLQIWLEDISSSTTVVLFTTTQTSGTNSFDTDGMLQAGTSASPQR